MASKPETGTRLYLPCDDPEQWARVQTVLSRKINCWADLDAVLSEFSNTDPFPKVCSFFQTVPGSPAAGKFDFELFYEKGLPFLVNVALEMPQLFDGVVVPISKTNSACRKAEHKTLNRKSFALSRRQCACLLAHSFLGSLKRPEDVERNNYRFTAVDLFMGTAVSPNSATTFLNYFSMLGKHGVPDRLGSVTFERRGIAPHEVPWSWENSARPLCDIQIVSGSIEDCTQADLHLEFANAFIGGGVMTGDFAMEEILFLVKPELMLAMALQNRMTDTEVICVHGAAQYSMVHGYGSAFEFAGDCSREVPESAVPESPGPWPPTVAAVDAIRGGGPAMTENAMLRDMNKVRIAFDGFSEVATGHWGCGAFGNNHDLMFLKQWLAASEAGVRKLRYHEFDRNQSHHILPLVRRLKHKTVGQLWSFLQTVTSDLRPGNVAAFSKRMADVAVGRLEVDPSSDTLPAGATRAPSTFATPPGEAGRGAPAPALQREGGHADAERRSTGLRRMEDAQLAPATQTATTLRGDGLEGRVVLHRGARATCIKATADGQLRLQMQDTGRLTWARKSEVTATASPGE